jgi:hypothetical protein
MDYHGKRIIRHDGGADGFVTTTCFVPSLNLGIVILTNTDANNFYSALRTQILDAYLGAPYVNQSEKVFNIVMAKNKKEAEELKKLREIVARKPTPALNITEYTGKYRNKVYGEIEIKTIELPTANFFPGKISKTGSKLKAESKLTIFFSHHPQLMGTLEALGENEFLCTYNIPTYGIKKINFKVEEGKVKSVIIRVNDFVDKMEYEFVKQ